MIRFFLKYVSKECGRTRLIKFFFSFGYIQLFKLIGHPKKQLDGLF